MAERTRFEASGDEGLRWLSVALRREARTERPTFSSALQERVVQSLAVRRAMRGGRAAETAAAGRGRRTDRAATWIGAVGGLAAAACVAVMMAGPRPEPPGSVSAAVAAQGIEVLPTPEEIGTRVIAEVATLAAAAVGVPDLPDLAAFDPSSFVAAADPLP